MTTSEKISATLPRRDLAFLNSYMERTGTTRSGALHEAVHALQEKLLGAGFLTETRPLLPHVTLVRKLHLPGALPEPGCFEWHAEELVLARSVHTESGSEYRAVWRWPLT